MAQTGPRRTRTATRPSSSAAILAARREARDRSLRRNGLLILVAIAVLGVTWSVRTVPNEAHPEAVALTRQLDATFDAVRVGDLELGPQPEDVGDGVAGGRFDRPNGSRWVLVGEAGGDCYAVWWDEAGTRRPRTVPTIQPCEPAGALTTSHPRTFDRIARAVTEDEPVDIWSPVLPDPWRFRAWFLPVVIVGGGIALGGLVRMSIALLTGDAPSARRR